MSDVPEIDLQAARERLEAGATLFMDVRDPASFASGHIPGAKHVHDGNLRDFLDETDREKPIVVYCYHGNSSRGGAAYLLGQGFSEVYSMSGGFEAWRAIHADRIGAEPD